VLLRVSLPKWAWAQKLQGWRDLAIVSKKEDVILFTCRTNGGGGCRIKAVPCE